LPSAWPSSEPVGELDRAAVAELATDYPDQEIVSYMLHGYPGPRISPRCLLGQPVCANLLSRFAAGHPAYEVLVTRLVIGQAQQRTFDSCSLCVLLL